MINKSKKAITLILVAFLSITYLSSTTFISNGETIKYSINSPLAAKQIGSTTTSVNMRSGASTKYKVIIKLKKNTKVDVLKKMTNGWYQVKYNGKTGYVSGRYLKLTTKSIPDNLNDAPTGISISEFEKLLHSMGFGDSYGNGLYLYVDPDWNSRCGSVKIHNEKINALFTFNMLSENSKKALKKSFNLLLPTQGDKLFDMVITNSNKASVNTIMDSRNVKLMKDSYLIIVQISDNL